MKSPEVFEQVIAVNVDVQNDFCPGGALAVVEGDLVVPPLNAINTWTRLHNGEVIFTGDWHRKGSAHFMAQGGPWPEHCLQYKAGAAFHDDLDVQYGDTVALKGQGMEDDGYSGWYATLGKDSKLYSEGQLLIGGGGWKSEATETVRDVALNSRRDTAVIVGGLATDYCVKATVLDALKDAERITGQGYTIGVFVLQDAVRAVNVNPGDGEAAIAEMKAAGATFVTTDDVIAGRVLQIGA